MYKSLGLGILTLILIIFMNNTHLKVSGSTDQVQGNILASSPSKENVTMTIMFNTFQTSGKSLVEGAADILRSNHPDIGINIEYIETGKDNNNTRYQMLNAITNGTAVDIVTLDQIWLGEFAQKGLLTDLTNYTKNWGGLSDL